MRVVGAQKGITYLSAPISTGLRDLALMRKYGVTKQELRERYPREYRAGVIAPNERESHKYAVMVRKLEGDRIVLDPGELYVPEWTQPDYWAFWEEAIRGFAVEVALAPGWAFSTGARLEAKVALQTSLRIIDVKGRELSADDLQVMDARARAHMLRDGWSQAQIEEYIPWMDFTAAGFDRSDYDDNIRAFSDIAERHNTEVRERRGDEQPE
jgi:hypothetical protein